MLPSFMRNQAFVAKRYPLVNDHGNTVPDYTQEPAFTTSLRGSIQPGSGTTDVINRDGAEIVYTIWCPNARVDVTHYDLVDLPDGTYFVNGEPERWQTGVLDHATIRLSRWAG